MTAPKKDKKISDKDTNTAKNKDTAKGKDRSKKADKSKKKVKESKKTESSEKLPPVDDRYLRLQADFDNYRKRVLREKSELYNRANEDIMGELLPVLDHLDLALNAVGVDREDPVVKGFELVGEQLKSSLKKFGLSQIDAAGKEFDPNLHEAIMHTPSVDVEEDLIVSDARKGYMLGERLLRASQVVVSSGQPEEEKEEQAEDQPEE